MYGGGAPVDLTQAHPAANAATADGSRNLDGWFYQPSKRQLLTFLDRGGGLDTVSLNWSHQGGTRLLSRLATDQDTLPLAGGVLYCDRPDSDMRVMAWPTYGVIKAEGRLAAIVDSDAESFRLGTRAELAAVDQVMREQISELLGDAPTGPPAGVSRFDLTTEREFSDGAEGQRVLRAFRALGSSARYVVESVAEVGGTLRAVSVKTAKRHVTVFRVYDKGIESGSHDPGRRIRWEAQNRVLARRRQTPEALASSDLAHQFARTFEPFMQADETTVTAPASIVDQLVQRMTAGEISPRVAARLVGDATMIASYGRGIYANEQLAQRRLAALRAAGVAVDDQLPPGAAVPIGKLLRQLVAEFTL